MFQQVLNFWFKEIDRKQWWKVDADFDEHLKKTFNPLLQQAVAGELFSWRASVQGRLAEIIVLDQFSRNIFRGTPQSFAQDPQALVLAQEAITNNALNALNETERSFLLMPLMHSESRIIHSQAEALFKEFTPDNNYQFELRHKAIIDRFSRYPHRNSILGRTSTEEEIAFLKEPGSSF